ncbi:hypothetical protein BEI46_06990 [Aliivibrio fischeri]|uniref:hypothetical protein n=1 Tax=Aliivibrio fischeri TaxID=668 RepID=UPI00084C644C|nr:hypothetical protein [Aliivibrio fischeri]OED51205.1 hypothetical protein BEI46_06990 [Aliivibrio fischeri]
MDAVSERELAFIYAKLSADYTIKGMEKLGKLTAIKEAGGPDIFKDILVGSILDKEVENDKIRE